MEAERGGKDGGWEGGGRQREEGGEERMEEGREGETNTYKQHFTARRKVPCLPLTSKTRASSS